MDSLNDLEQEWIRSGADESFIQWLADRGNAYRLRAMVLMIRGKNHRTMEILLHRSYNHLADNFQLLRKERDELKKQLTIKTNSPRRAR